MARSLKLMLTESVDGLGIVGDVVSVRLGYARNFLLPRSMATIPSDEAIAAVASKRAEAQRQLAELRKQRESIVGKLDGFELSLERSCNDLGILYAAVTQQEIATALVSGGFAVKPRDVRLSQVIKRVDNYDIHIKFESDLEAVIKLHVLSDRKLDLDRGRNEPEAAEPAAQSAPQGEAAAEGKKGAKSKAPEAGGKAEGEAPAPAEGKKPEKADKPKKAKGEKAAGDKPAGEETKSSGKSGWGKTVEMPSFEGIPAGRGSRRERK